MSHLLLKEALQTSQGAKAGAYVHAGSSGSPVQELDGVGNGAGGAADCTLGTVGFASVGLSGTWRSHLSAWSQAEHLV